MSGCQRNINVLAILHKGFQCGQIATINLFTHTIFVATRCTGKLLQGVMCQLLINYMTRPIVKNVPVVAIAFNIPVCCVYIYSCRDSLKVHRYLSVLVE